MTITEAITIDAIVLMLFAIVLFLFGKGDWK